MPSQAKKRPNMAEISKSQVDNLLSKIDPYQNMRDIVRMLNSSPTNKRRDRNG